MAMDPKNGSISSGQESEMSTDATSVLLANNKVDDKNTNNSVKPETIIDDGDKATDSKRDESVVDTSLIQKGKRNPHSGKKKKIVKKVDWTPELHKKFVQAVEQLGVDKEAVPSKILELMGTDCLTRHNVASHLQKYRSHRKHVLAREAETANWNRRRQTYGTVGRTVKKDMNFCVPTTAFPPVTPMPHFRPLHVWGYPPTWGFHHPLPPLLHNGDASFWYSYHHQDVPAPGMPCSFIPRAFTPQPVPGIPNTHMYRVDPYTSVGMPSAFTTQELPKPLDDFDMSKESLDAAIGDVLSKPWLPLPIGLKPPSIDSVMSELQRQGISRIQPDFYLASH